jgi:hypothetical protein
VSDINQGIQPFDSATPVLQVDRKRERCVPAAAVFAVPLEKNSTQVPDVLPKPRA